MPRQRGQRAAPAGGDWSRRYPPIVSGLVAVALAALVLPSALNVPQTPPSQTLEFAPVPPQDEAPPPDEQGSLSSLGLGSSSAGPAADGIGGGGAGPAPAPPTPDGRGDNIVTKRCVGTPPRQTSDPAAPPCVAHFDGDNGGSTSSGVTRDEVRILFYFDGGGDTEDSENGTSRGSEQIPANTMDDLWDPPQPEEFVYNRMLRLHQAYFTERFQTYGRRAHFFVQFGTNDNSTTPETRRADAELSIEQADPFVVVNYARESADAYTDAMTRHGVVTFLAKIGGIGSLGETSESLAKRPGLIWSYDPSLEDRAEVASSYVCQKVLGHPVSFGDPALIDRERKLALIWDSRGNLPDYTAWGDGIRQRMHDCGAEFVEATVNPQEVERSAANMASLQSQGVTTIIWVAGQAFEHTFSAKAINYFPEWIVPGDLKNDSNFGSRLYDQDVWQHARTMSTYPLVEDPDRRVCMIAMREAQPEVPRNDAAIWGCGFYINVFQLMTGVQVAGPNLTATSMDRGFHAIPRIQSGDPAVPACFYLPADYTCLKDWQLQWWDPTGVAPGTQARGCWRSMQGGRRHLVGQWPAGDVDAQRDPQDRCNFQGVELA